MLPRLAEAREEANPFFAFYYSVNLVYGANHNPHDGTRSAGGSSGGEGAAIPAAMSPAGFGSDLGSSIRQPAHFNGVFGMSPSRGVVPLAPATDRARPRWASSAARWGRWRARPTTSSSC